MTETQIPAGPEGSPVEKDACRTYSVRKAASILGVGAATLYRAIQREEVPFVPIGKRRLVPRVWVDQQVEKTG